MFYMFYLIHKNVKKKFNNFDEKMQLLIFLNKIMLLCVGIYIEKPLQKNTCQTWILTQKPNECHTPT